MKNSERPKAQTPLLFSSCPTTGPTISVPDHAELAEVALLQGRLDFLGRAAQFTARFLAGVRHAHHDLPLCRLAVGLDDHVLPAARKAAIERGAHLVDARQLVELDDDGGAALELDAFRQAVHLDRERGPR